VQKSHILTLLVITTLVASLFIVSSLTETASATITTPSVDSTAGSHAIAFANNPSKLSITTSTTQEIIYATCYSKSSGKSLGISSNPTLTWHYRGGGNTSQNNGEIAAWWAVSPTAQSITITFSGSGTGGSVMAAFCVKNADTSSPFDPNLSSASYSLGSSITASSSLTTTNPNELVVGVVGTNNNKVITAQSGYTQIDNTGTTQCSGANEYLQASTKGTYAPSFNIASNTPWVEVADAFVPVSQSVTITSSPQTGQGFITVNGTARTTPYTATWTPGTVLALSATGTVSGGTGKQYVYASWSDAGAQTHYYTVQSASETVTANYQTQYQVTFTQSGLDSSTATGTVLTVNGTNIQYSSLSYNIWVNSGDKLVYSYNPTVLSTTSGKQFTLSSTQPTSPLTVTSAQTVTGTYQPQYQVTFNVNPSGSGTINQADGYYSGATSITANPASGYSFDHWSSDTGSISFGDTAASTTTMTTTGTGTVTATFTQNSYQTILTVTANNDTIDKGNALTITGALSSQGIGISGKTMVLSFYNVSQWQQISSVTTQSDGTYQYLWTVPTALANGQYMVKADFAGDSPYLASSSIDSGTTLTLTVLPEYSFGGLTAIAVCLAAMLAFYRYSKSTRKPKP